MLKDATTQEIQAPATEADVPSAASPSVPSDGLRETIESVVVAFLVAFLFRTFCAEAFVIPTGSMAPTLMGRHKDLVCTECGFEFRVNAASEVDKEGRRRVDSRGRPAANTTVLAGTCPSCRHTMPLDPEGAKDQKHPSFNGDRILAGKSFLFNPPKRWDVTVFRYPAEAHDNFIKRLVGMPNELVRISHGDILTGPLLPLKPATMAWEEPADPRTDRELTMQRKPPNKVRAMLQEVNHNDYLPTKLLKVGWLPRWQAVESRQGDANWSSIDEGRAFTIPASSAGDHWIRYQHVVATDAVWKRVKAGLPLDEGQFRPRPQLITDFYGYNTFRHVNDFNVERVKSLGQHWVGDLALECELDVHSATGTVTLELVEGGVQFHCAIDVATGVATQSISALEGFRRIGTTPIRGPGKHTVMWANVDDQLLLWVDDELIAFDGPAAYESLDNHAPTPLDLQPVGIAANGAQITVRHLRVLRDVYYIAVRHGMDNSDYLPGSYPSPTRAITAADFNDLMADPNRWGALKNLSHADYRLGPGQYLMLGDNSPESSDGRWWARDHYFVEEELLIGKAELVFWPHAWPTAWSWQLPRTNVHFPFYPSISRMGWIH